MWKLVLRYVVPVLMLVTVFGGSLSGNTVLQNLSDFGFWFVLLGTAIFACAVGIFVLLAFIITSDMSERSMLCMSNSNRTTLLKARDTIGEALKAEHIWWTYSIQGTWLIGFILMGWTLPAFVYAISAGVLYGGRQFLVSLVSTIDKMESYYDEHHFDRDEMLNDYFADSTSRTDLSK